MEAMSGDGIGKGFQDAVAGRYSPEAFDALLAVAKAVEADREDVNSAINWRTMHAFQYLDAAFPSWREWGPTPQTITLDQAWRPLLGPIL